MTHNNDGAHPMNFCSDETVVYLNTRAVMVLLALSVMLAACKQTPMQAGLSDTVRDYATSTTIIPDMEGFGVNTPGGRGGQIIRVRNTDARGPGSLREALETQGPRIILFEAGGIIDLEDPIRISHPYATVAGETAPSPGVTVIGAGMVIETHDVLVRHLRFRIGDRLQGPAPDARDGISVYESPFPDMATYNVIIDHCSVSWAVDEGMSCWGKNIFDITFSRCIIAENLSRSLHPEGEHSKGMLIGDHARRVAIIGNLFAHNMERNPFIKGNVSALIANNVIYNPGTAAIHFGDFEKSGPSLGAATGNVLIPGPDTRRLLPLFKLQLDINPQSRVYAFNNDSGGRVLKRSLAGCNSWKAVDAYDAAAVRVRPLTLYSTDHILEQVLKTAGARPADRDGTDARIVEAVRTGKGKIIDCLQEVGGFPAHAPVYRVLNPPEHAHDINDNGYSRIENWIRDFATRVESV